jgi:hypothetical protein
MLNPTTTSMCRPAGLLSSPSPPQNPFDNYRGFSLFPTSSTKGRAMRADEGYSYPSCGTMNRCVTQGQIIACCMFQWAPCAVLPVRQIGYPCGGNVQANSPVFGRSGPWLWRMWRHVDRPSPDVEVIIPLVMELTVRVARMNSHQRQVALNSPHPCRHFLRTTEVLTLVK